MKKERFERAQIEVILLRVDDVICTSLIEYEEDETPLVPAH